MPASLSSAIVAPPICRAGRRVFRNTRLAFCRHVQRTDFAFMTGMMPASIGVDSRSIEPLSTNLRKSSLS